MSTTAPAIATEQRTTVVRFPNVRDNPTKPGIGGIKRRSATSRTTRIIVPGSAITASEFHKGQYAEGAPAGETGCANRLS